MEYHLKKDFDKIPIMWKPKENSGANVKKFIKKIENKYNRKFSCYWDFHKWSIDHTVEFWTEIWDYCNIIYSKNYEKVIDLNIPMEDFPNWFEGAQLNFAENVLKYQDDKVALILAGEDRGEEKVTYAQLFREVSLYAAAFRKVGLQKGDIVAGYMSNRKEVIFAMIAVASIGAIWTGAVMRMGPQGVLCRLSQLKPKFLITVDRFHYDGDEWNLLQNIEEVTNGLLSLSKVIFVPAKENSTLKDITKIRNSCFLDDFLSIGKDRNGFIPPMKFEQVSMSHPVFITFTSGSTGLPKALVHGSGVLLSVIKDYGIQGDSDRDSVWMSNTSVGFGTWNGYIPLLSTGCSILLFDGLPYFLSRTYLWDLIDRFKITHLLPFPSIIDKMEKGKYIPTESHSLKSVKIFNAVGGLVKPISYDFMNTCLKENSPFSARYGLTEFLGCPCNIELTMPVYRGEINAFILGYNVECLDGEGKHVVGEIGELVLSKPVPNLPLGIWGDEDYTKYREKYFHKYSGKFVIGDYGLINPVTKGIIICGRSDTCLSQRELLFGCLEIYNVVEKFPEVLDSICVSQYNKIMDARAVLFLKMRNEYAFNQELVSKIKVAITKALSYKHVPDLIIKVEDIPYSINGKKMESLVKKIINRQPYETNSVSNPNSLKYFINNEQLYDFSTITFD